MSLHDDYARMTPFEIAFPDSERVQALSAAVAEEAAGRGADPSDPQAFITMGAVGAFVRELQAPDAPPDAVHQYGALVFHAVHFLHAGCPLYLLDTAVTRSLVGGAPDAEPEPPTTAGYLQLPQHLFWTSGSEGDTPESLDGMFWTVTELGILQVLPITGLRPDRPGFGAFPLPEAPVAEASDWLHATVRETEDDYASALPGGGFDELYSVEAAGEVLKFLARFFAYLSSAPSALEASQPADEQTDGPLPSALPFTRVTLVA